MYRSPRTVLLATALYLALLPLAGQAANRALFIGTAKYKDGRSTPLPTTRFDANDMRDTMIQQGMVKPGNTGLLIGRNTKQEILDALRKRTTGMGESDILYVYNSSHGTEDGEIQAYDEDIVPPDMADIIAKSGCKKVVFINDSCHSEAFQLEFDKGSGIVVSHINAASKENVSWSTSTPLKGMGHGTSAMTKWMIEGLTDGAADINGNGSITMKELTGWVSSAVKAFENNDVSLVSYNNPPSLQNVNCSGSNRVISAAQPGKPFISQRLVPKLVGLDREEALARLAADKLKPIVEPFTIPEKDWLRAAWAGKVCKQVPPRGQRTQVGSEVAIEVVSAEVRIVPNVYGKKPSKAYEAIKNKDLVPEHVSPTNVPNPTVDYVNPIPRTAVVEKSTVRFGATRSGFTVVPDVRKLRTPAIARAMKEASLRWRHRTVTTNDYDIFKPSYWHGRASTSRPKHAKIIATNSVVTVDMFPDKFVVVPNLTGKSEDEAEQLLTPLSLSLLITTYTNILKEPAGIRGNFAPQPQAYTGDVISADLNLKEIPDFTGKTVRQAKWLASSLTLKPVINDDDDAWDPRKQGIVYNQTPSPGEPIVPGADLTLFVPRELSLEAVYTNAFALLPTMKEVKDLKCYPLVNCGQSGQLTQKVTEQDSSGEEEDPELLFDDDGIWLGDDAYVHFDVTELHQHPEQTKKPSPCRGFKEISVKFNVDLSINVAIAEKWFDRDIDEYGKETERTLECVSDIGDEAYWLGGKRLSDGFAPYHKPRVESNVLVFRHANASFSIDCSPESDARAASRRVFEALAKQVLATAPPRVSPPVIRTTTP